MFLDDIVSPMGIEEAKATKQRLDAKCWTGYKKQGTKVKGGVRVNNCVPKESVVEDSWHAGDNAWSSENHEMVESHTFSNGDQVELKPEYADRAGEVYTVSQCDRERGRCWIGDADGRGWYARFDQLVPSVEHEEFEAANPAQQAAIAIAKKTASKKSDQVNEEDQVKKVFNDKSGKPVGEIGIDPESSPGNGEWYVYHYATGYSVVGFDSAAEAKRELMYVHKHPEEVEGHPSTLDEQGVAEGFETGSQVQHPQFGAGKISKIWPTGMITVTFSNYPDPVSKKLGVQVNMRPGESNYEQLKQGVAEDTTDSSEAVESAIIRRIIGNHANLIAQYGPEAIMSAARDVAEWNSDAEEIGTSDVSGWVREVFRKLKEEY